MDLRADVMGNQSYDPLCSRQSLPGVRQAFREPVDPQPAIEVEHHFDDCWILWPGCDGRRQHGSHTIPTCNNLFCIRGRHGDPLHTDRSSNGGRASWKASKKVSPPTACQPNETGAFASETVESERK
jgi:hypothetical protein